MKKVVLVLFAFLFFSVGQAFAYRVTDFSTDAKIVAAMRVLEQAGENDVFRNLQRYGMRIKFDDLSMVMNGKNAYAVSTYNNFGTRVILINSVYRNAPAEQIACLIAHEAITQATVLIWKKKLLQHQKKLPAGQELKLHQKFIRTAD